MKRRITLFSALSALILSSCYAQTPATELPTVFHMYDIHVKDQTGMPIKGVKIEYKLKDFNDSVSEEENVAYTDEEGTLSIRARAKSRNPYTPDYHTSVYYYVYTPADKFFSSEHMDSTYGSKYTQDKSPIKTQEVVLFNVPITHQYRLHVLDFDGNAVEGATIEYTLFDGSKEVVSDLYVTEADGLLAQSIKATASGIEYPSYATRMKYKITKKDYYTQEDSLVCEYGSKYSSDKLQVEKALVLIQPSDYFTSSFATSNSYITFKKNILRFLFEIEGEALLGKCIMQYRSIEVGNFKNKKYLKLCFDNSVVFNSLRLNKYDIGKRIFDDLVRKLLNPLNSYIYDPMTFHGYDIIVTGHSKDFSKEYATPDDIEYRYLIPAESARKYKNKDIAGQAVLDSSIILIDDERVDLKLQ